MATIYGRKPEEILIKLQDYYRLIEAAGGLVQNEKGEYLFILRLGKWDLPKGKAEKGETHLQNALREVKEETGLQNLETLESMPSSFHMYHLKGHVVLKRTHWFKMKVKGSDKLIPQLEENIELAEWIAPTDLKKVLDNTYASIYNVIQNAVK